LKYCIITTGINDFNIIILVCHNRLIHGNKVFTGRAARGKTSTGCFYGLQLFLVINAFGEIMNAFFTLGNVADNHLPTMIRLFSKLKGWAFADKDFINQNALAALVNRRDSNMKSN